MFTPKASKGLSGKLKVTVCQRFGKVKRPYLRSRHLHKTKFTFQEAVDVWLRHWSGQTGDTIAHDYRINAGRVSEVLNEEKHFGSKQVAASKRSA